MDDYSPNPIFYMVCTTLAVMICYTCSKLCYCPRRKQESPPPYEYEYKPPPVFIVGLKEPTFSSS